MFFLGDGGDFLGQFDRALAAFEPVVGNGRFGAGLLGDFANQFQFGFGIGVEFIDADDRPNAGLADDLNMGNQILAAFFKQVEIFLFVFDGQRRCRV